MKTTEGLFRQQLLNVTGRDKIRFGETKQGDHKTTSVYPLIQFGNRIRGRVLYIVVNSNFIRKLTFYIPSKENFIIFSYLLHYSHLSHETLKIRKTKFFDNKICNILKMVHPIFFFNFYIINCVSKTTSDYFISFYFSSYKICIHMSSIPLCSCELGERLQNMYVLKDCTEYPELRKKY